MMRSLQIIIFPRANKMDNLRLRERSERRGQVKVLMRYKETGEMQKTASFARGARPGGGSSEGTLLAAM